MKTTTSLSLFRLAATVLPCVILCTVLHAIGPEMRYAAPSSILGSRAFAPIAFGLLTAVYSLLAVLFWREQHSWPGLGWRKGLRFAAAYAPFWTAGVLFMPIFFHSSWRQELYTAAVDLIAMLVLGALAGCLLRREATTSSPAPRPDWSVLPTMLVVWLVVRYGLQRALLGFLTGPAVAPAAMLAWEIGMGLSLGVLWLTLGSRRGTRTPWRHALWIGGWLFGGVYGLSAGFVPLFVTSNLPELAVSMGIDIVTVVGAVYVHGLVVTRRVAQLAPGF